MAIISLSLSLPLSLSLSLSPSIPFDHDHLHIVVSAFVIIFLNANDKSRQKYYIKPFKINYGTILHCASFMYCKIIHKQYINDIMGVLRIVFNPMK